MIDKIDVFDTSYILQMLKFRSDDVQQQQNCLTVCDNMYYNSKRQINLLEGLV